MNEFSGSVPQYYRDVYDIVSKNEVISQGVFTKLLERSGLERSILAQIYECIDCKGSVISRTNLYKALSLVAFAQQNKPISPKLLDNFQGEELPKPKLGDLESLKFFLKPNISTPTILNVCYAEFCNYDVIEVKLVPEKKGIFLKHSEYEITSRRNNSTVKRRYNDFVAFNELIQHSFPDRMVPRLPPKKMMLSADRDFIEARRKSLRRFLLIISRHPAMYDSALLQFFLTYTGHEVVHKIKEQFRGIPDEFERSSLTDQTKDLVPPETQTEFAASKEHIRQITTHVVKLRDMATRISERSKGNAADILGFGKELIAIGNDGTTASAWATGGNDVIATLKRAFRSLSHEFSLISEKHSLQGIREEEGVLDQLSMLVDILQAYHNLCDRHERGVLRDHHSALKRYGMMKTKRMAATVTNMEQGGVDRIESKILAQEHEIANRENRNFFALHCIHLETQLVYANMQILSEVVGTLVATQIKGHKEMMKLWEDVAPRVTDLLPNETR
uniref:sorting nexin-8 n=1 Tax=Ciona intestinalis TaxID=7719 RepID=UPI000180B4D7|nr:sorting nexin-8 [Ciona intestinalis]|eukprot:XP_002127832.1 sorting nexin-8 [Ciona intestinalis]